MLAVHTLVWIIVKKLLLEEHQKNIPSIEGKIGTWQSIACPDLQRNVCAMNINSQDVPGKLSQSSVTLSKTFFWDMPRLVKTQTRLSVTSQNVMLVVNLVFA